MKTIEIIQTALAYTIVLSCFIYICYKVKPILKDYAAWFAQEEERENND
jgi:hypothetical protein